MTHSSNWLRFWVGFLAALLVAKNAWSYPSWLPIYIEFAHAGSFYFFASELPPQESCTLIHIDAHSDASAIYDSDSIRRLIREGATPAERNALFYRWRCQGRIQSFGWIEPLMPNPFSRVVWIPSQHLSSEQQTELQRLARSQLNAYEEIHPRQSTGLANCYIVHDLEWLIRAVGSGELESGPVVVSIDLDYFAQLPDDQTEAVFTTLFQTVLKIRHLRALSFALSVPYLRDVHQAEMLLALALNQSVHVKNASVEFEPFATVGTDKSLKVREWLERQGSIPDLHLERSSPTLKSLLLQICDHLTIRYDSDRWRQLTATWQKQSLQPKLRLSSGNGADALTLDPSHPDGQIDVDAVPEGANVAWYCLKPDTISYNLSERMTTFAADAPRWISQSESSIPADPHATRLAADQLLALFSNPSRLGTISVYALVQNGADNLRTPTVRVSSVPRELGPFRQGLSQQFGLPYIFQIASLSNERGSGPDLGFGADCANFLIAGLRQAGWQIPWGDPGMLKRYLEEVAQFDFSDDAPNPSAHLMALSPDDVQRGVLLHFGYHVAALWQTATPGYLSPSDLVAHQLEGCPEIVPLSQLLRDHPHLRVLVPPRKDSDRWTTVLLGGDAMLGRSIGRRIDAGEDVLAASGNALRSATFTFLNLECALPGNDAKPPTKKYVFRGSLAAGGLLQKYGIKAMLVANNHTFDFGPAGFVQTIQRLAAWGVQPIGGGRNKAEAAMPRAFSANAVKLAIVGCVQRPDAATVAGPETPGILAAEDDLAIEDSIHSAKATGAFTIIYTHWNADSERKTCRDFARTWIEAGADLVAGTGPHGVLDSEIIDGKPVFYSLGNFLFDEGRGAWNRGALLELKFSEAGKLIRARIIDTRTGTSCDTGPKSVDANQPGNGKFDVNSLTF